MRMIERWFPCTEVSEASASGWGSGKQREGTVHVVRRTSTRAGKGGGSHESSAVAGGRGRTADGSRTWCACNEGRDAAHAEVVEELAKTLP